MGLPKWSKWGSPEYSKAIVSIVDDIHSYKGFATSLVSWWWAKIGGGIDHYWPLSDPLFSSHLYPVYTPFFYIGKPVLADKKASWLPRRSRKFMQFPTSVCGQPHSTSSNGDIYRIILRKPRRTAANQTSGDFRQQKQNIEMNLWMYETLYYSYGSI
jgi:hypothetical protein